MESWRKVWRDGLAPLLSVKALNGLRRLVVADDKRLLQGATSVPPPLQCVQTWPVEAACVVGCCGWEELGGIGTTVEAQEIEEYFARMCFECDRRLGEPAGVRWFINWADETPRDEMRRRLLPEIDLALAGKEAE